MALASLTASQVDFMQSSQEILSQSTFYIDKKDLDFQHIKTDAIFISTNSENINLGFVSKTTLWIKLLLENKKNQKISKVLEVVNPLLENITLYDEATITKKGIKDDDYKRNIHTSFDISLKALQTKTVYLEVKNSTTALRLGLYLKDKEIYLEEEQFRQAKIFFFFGILSMLLFYMCTLYIYTREKSYAYYSFYLLALIAQQSTYQGLSQIFLPSWLMYYDNLAVVFKVNILYITAAIFAKSFLQIKNYPSLERVYDSIIIIAILEMPLFGFPQFYYPEVAVLTGFVFVIFNMFVGIYVYLHGYKQARFFVIGWSFLVVGFTLMILDGLGIIAIMQNMPNLIMYLTTLEAILLSLAFTDRYHILKVAKEEADSMLYNTLQERQQFIEDEIKLHTEEFSSVLENKQVLLKELHHRTKNNLQLILSLVRMQADSDDELLKGKYNDLEYRINATAKTHQMLYVKDDLQKINMDDYIQELCYDLENLSDKNLIFDIQMRQIYMPLREASYIGLIVNELVTNSIKHVHLSNVFVGIDMHKSNNVYTLEIRDNGNGVKFEEQGRKGIGMKLVKILVEEQLEGTLNVSSQRGLKYTIEYRL